MTKIKGTVVVDATHCKGCNLCVVACRQKVLALQPAVVNDKGYHYAYMAQPEACVGCTACGEVCPDGCITVYRSRTVINNK